MLKRPWRASGLASRFSDSEPTEIPRTPRPASLHLIFKKVLEGERPREPFLRFGTNRKSADAEAGVPPLNFKKGPGGRAASRAVSPIRNRQKSRRRRAWKRGWERKWENGRGDTRRRAVQLVRLLAPKAAHHNRTTLQLLTNPLPLGRCHTNPYNVRSYTPS